MSRTGNRLARLSLVSRTLGKGRVIIRGKCSVGLGKSLVVELGILGDLVGAGNGGDYVLAPSVIGDGCSGGGHISDGTPLVRILGVFVLFGRHFRGLVIGCGC